MSIVPRNLGPLFKFCHKNSISVKKLWVLLKELLVDWLDHEVEHCPYANQAGHCIHGVVVDERRWVERALRHDGHQLADGQCLGFNQSLSLGEVGTKDFLETLRINFGEQIWNKNNTNLAQTLTAAIFDLI